MPNYVKTGPFTNGGAPGISAAFLNAIENVFEQSAGGTETGKYFLQGQGYTSLANYGNYMESLSRTTVPVSVTIDQADQAPTGGANTPGAQNLTSNGFLVFFTVGSASSAAKTGGNFTIQY